MLQSQNTSLETLAESELKVGNTPIPPIEHPDIPSKIKVYAKLENVLNTGSVKARPAARIFYELIKGINYVLDFKDGRFIKRILEYKPGMKHIDSSSGNYVRAFAYYGSICGLPVTLFALYNSEKT